MIANTRQMAVTSIALVLLVGLAAGCATKQTVSERNFGAAVRQMIDAQTHDREAAQNPDPMPVRVLDGGQAAEVIEVHRKDVSKPQEIRNEIHINVGG